VAGGLFLFSGAAQAQSLGHRVPGTLGIHAGDQPGVGLSFVGQFLAYNSNRAFDRDGRPLSIAGLGVAAQAGAIGVGVTFKLPGDGPYLGAVVGIPYGHLSTWSDVPATRTDRQGVGDTYFQPLRLGAKLRCADLNVSYALYLPTGVYDSDGERGFGNGQITHEISAGGSVFSDAKRALFASALASLDLNGPKRSIDLTRGATVTIQGGVGVTLHPIVNAGLAGYALWQVSDDVGGAVPQILRGARERVYGLGPEVNVAIPPIRAALSARYVRDFGVVSRPEAGLFFMSLVWRAWDFGTAAREEPTPGAEPIGIAL